MNNGVYNKNANEALQECLGDLLPAFSLKNDRQFVCMISSLSQISASSSEDKYLKMCGQHLVSKS